MRLSIPEDGSAPEIYVRDPGDNLVLMQTVFGDTQAVEATPRQLAAILKALHWTVTEPNE